MKRLKTVSYTHLDVYKRQGKRLPNGDLDISKPVQSVGRVRSNYTSLELAKIKGLPSERIHDVLGYSVSEYVAHRENIAFPPQF